MVEVASIGPGPFCAMLLADLGAEVLRLDRADTVAGGSGDGSAPPEPMLRGRRSVGIDLKHPAAPGVVRRLSTRADVLVEGFRPGVMERLGLGPAELMGANPALVYGRMTGWGQEGPLAPVAGHDIDYIAVAGVLGALGPAGEPPTVPLNLIADFGGGGMLLAFGVLAALWEREHSGRGQVVDAAMVDGAALLTTMLHGHLAHGVWSRGRGENLLDGGAPFYRAYRTADERYVAVGCLEPHFFAELLAGLELESLDPAVQYDATRWPDVTRQLERAFASRTQAEWMAVFDGTDACVAPVMEPVRAPHHPHLAARDTFVTIAGVVQPAPAPRFGRSPVPTPGPPPHPGEHTRSALEEWGFGDGEVDQLVAVGALR